MDLRRADAHGWRYAVRTADSQLAFPRAREDGSLGLRGGEALRLSSAGPCRASNPYADLALLDAEGDGIPLSMTDPGEGDILFAYCPSSGLLVPGMIHEEEKKGRRSSLMEMALSLPKGERAFVLNEGRDSLVTASLPSDSSDRLRLLPRLSVMSWLMSSGSRAAQESREYDVEGNGEFFVLRHRLGGPSLRGRFKGADKEIDDISWKVAITGLGGIIGGYDLEEE